MRLNVVELTDGERDALIAAADRCSLSATHRAASDLPDPYDLSVAKGKLDPTEPPAQCVVALRKIAEGTGAAAGWAREALEEIGDRVSPDAQEVQTIPNTAKDLEFARARDHADAQGGGTFVE